MTRQMQKGFTLIELMIVVAIIGILAAVGIPQYQDYITKAKASKIATSVDALKTAIAEQYQNGVFPATSDPALTTGSDTTAWNSWLGISNPPSVNADISEVAITGVSGAIQVTLTGTIASSINGHKIRWVPVATGTEVDWVVCSDDTTSTGADLILNQQVAKWSNAPGLDPTNAAYTGGTRSSTFTSGGNSVTVTCTAA